MSKRRKRTKSQSFNLQSLPKQLQHINLNAAGIDIGSERHMVAVPEGRDEVSVREFGTFTADLIGLADWLQQCGVTKPGNREPPLVFNSLHRGLERWVL